jgi:hypothetical protein
MFTFSDISTTSPPQFTFTTNLKFRHTKGVDRYCKPQQQQKHRDKTNLPNDHQTPTSESLEKHQLLNQSQTTLSSYMKRPPQKKQPFKMLRLAHRSVRDHAPESRAVLMAQVARNDVRSDA